MSARSGPVVVPGPRAGSVAFALSVLECEGDTGPIRSHLEELMEEANEDRTAFCLTRPYRVFRPW